MTRRMWRHVSELTNGKTNTGRASSFDAPPPRLVSREQECAAQRTRDELSGDTATRERGKVTLPKIAWGSKK